MPFIDLRAFGREDWIKTLSWDLPDVQTLDDLLRHMKVLEGTPDEMTVALKKFQTLPAWRAAPPLLKSQAAAWLQAVGTKGGPGSGNFGHSGRPGQVGGSGPGGGPAASAVHDAMANTLGPKSNNLGTPDWLTPDHPFHAIQNTMEGLLAERAQLLGDALIKNHMNRMEAETLLQKLKQAKEDGVLNQTEFDKKAAPLQRKLEKLRKEAVTADRAADAVHLRAAAAVQIPASERGRLILSTVDPAVEARMALGVSLTEQYVHQQLLPHGLGVANGGLHGTERAYYQAGTIHITPTTTRSIIMHELAHAIEDRNPAIMARSHELVERRSGGASAVPMVILEPAGSYMDSEYAHPDEWQSRGGSNYTGKDYGGRATEVLSMGIERLASNPLQFFAQDREHFAHVVRSLHKMP